VARGQALKQLLDRVDSLRLAVVGDVMLDRFVFGRVERISPEAPVPVVHVRAEEERLGGAGNVAANIRSLGASVQLFAAVGAGEFQSNLFQRMSDLGLSTEGLLRCDDRVTSVKTRILGGGQQVVRIDRETARPLRDEDVDDLLRRLDELGPFDGFVVSDYGKGVVGPALMDRMRALHGSGKPVVVDPKQGNFELYRGVTCITPNANEAGAACHIRLEDDETAEAAAKELHERLETDVMLITRGEHGMSLRDEQGAMHHLPTRAREVFDVTGAGDTVIGTLACGLAAGLSARDAAEIANVAAGEVVREIGTARIRTHQLREAWGRDEVDRG